MKKTLTLLVLSFMTSILSYGQVTGVSIDSKKHYENNTTTAYLTLRGYYGTDIIVGMSEHLNAHPDISLFSFYDNKNPKKCMYTANNNLSETTLINIINDFLSEYYEFDISNDLSHTKYFADNKTVKFKVTGINDDNHKDYIISQLSELEFINAIKINQEGICKINTNKTIKGITIITAFNDLNLGIIEIDTQ
ncbi:MAG: hypothetical protein PHW82_13810 [Bacteroidales bacterium]|nr:hypothetical protein [Bacteroidales bacterium]